jgi:hypothetical protein
MLQVVPAKEYPGGHSYDIDAGIVVVVMQAVTDSVPPLGQE